MKYFGFLCIFLDFIRKYFPILSKATNFFLENAYNYTDLFPNGILPRPIPLRYSLKIMVKSANI